MKDHPTTIYQYPRRIRNYDREGFYLPSAALHKAYAKWIRGAYRDLRRAGINSEEARYLILDVMHAGRLMERRPANRWLLP